MIIDCDHCVMDGTTACDDCVVTALLAGEGALVRGPVELVTSEERALGHLAEEGLVAPLRLTPRDEGDLRVSGRS